MSKILIVDDAALMRTMVKNALKSSEKEYTLLEAKNGEEAIELFKATKPDLVTMDITMDIKNGVDAAKEIIELDKSANIIMITALGQEQYLKECIGFGVKDFIVKPFTKDRVISAVEKILEN